MKILFVMDKLEKLDQPWDTSLCLARELMRRGHGCFTADIEDLCAFPDHVEVNARPLFKSGQKTKPNGFDVMSAGNPSFRKIREFDLVLIRKDPPVDTAYLNMISVLEREASHTAMVNHPSGIRNTNEKLAILNFPDWIPKTIVSSCAETILKFQMETGGSLVIKPLNQKGGKGIFELKPGDSKAGALLAKATSGGKEMVMAQKFLPASAVEKRLVIIDGKLTAAFEKRAPKTDFRANLGLSGTFHPAKISAEEMALVKEMRPYLLKNGLLFVGLDVKGGYLIDFNVTSPAGLTECEIMYSRLGVPKILADSLESFVKNWKKRKTQLPR